MQNSMTIAITPDEMTDLKARFRSYLLFNLITVRRVEPIRTEHCPACREQEEAHVRSHR